MCAETRKALLNAGKLIAFTFTLGVAFQLGVSLTSQISPRVDVLEIQTADQGAEKPVG
ncbi:hypothetical protein SAMN05216571_10828 [Onishia taeanensis]|uniref:Uncharacterized protein n=1 Tax=Onishia taeanensis TaxID=284577 RepID=A0A1G7SX13_9GAMM|nr:hypothetical protein [Halomonas taeanensis]SDG27603.1 hypothetical protein SAMN05216571_10828 [Halomonas taeanensis]